MFESSMGFRKCLYLGSKYLKENIRWVNSKIPFEMDLIESEMTEQLFTLEFIPPLKKFNGKGDVLQVSTSCV